jgi:hypothetical protein
MENEYRRLAESLNHCLTVLDGAWTEPERTTGESRGEPHIELIDFDALRIALRQAVAAMAAVQSQQQDALAVREWFVNRITALRRGRRAILTHTSSDPDDAPSMETSLSGLVRSFEEESARLRRLTADRVRRSGDLTRAASEKYREFVT